MANKYIHAIGRRKTSSAQVRLYEWSGKNTINGRDIEEYVSRKDLFEVIFEPIKSRKLKDKVYFEVKIEWWGESSQAWAIRHGLARAIIEKDESLKSILKQDSLLTRDSRKVERKKPGKKKARKSPSWSKR